MFLADQVMPEDLEKFDSQIQEIQMQAIAAVVQFLDLHADENSDPLSGLGERKSVQRSTSQGMSVSSWKYGTTL